jgi:hypothetical protein
MELIRSIFVPVFKPVAVMLYNMVCSVPEFWVKIIFMAVFLALIIWVATLKKEGIDEKTGKPLSPVHDLRYFAGTILFIQLLFYIWLG